MQNPADESGVCKSTGVEGGPAYGLRDVDRSSVYQTATAGSQNRFLVLTSDRRRVAAATAALLNVNITQFHGVIPAGVEFRQMPFPVTRMRRLRSSEPMRRLVRETTLDPADFILPLFVCP